MPSNSFFHHNIELCLSHKFSLLTHFNETKYSFLGKKLESLNRLLSYKNLDISMNRNNHTLLENAAQNSCKVPENFL